MHDGHVAALLTPTCGCGQLRAHADVAGWLKKPIILSAFSKQRRTGKSDMAMRNAFYEMVYQEAERSDAIAGMLMRAVLS